MKTYFSETLRKKVTIPSDILVTAILRFETSTIDSKKFGEKLKEFLDSQGIEYECASVDIETERL